MFSLYLLFPNKVDLFKTDEEFKPDALSIAYLKVRLDSDRTNYHLRLALGRQLSQIGLFAEASQHLLSTLKSGDQRVRAKSIIELLKIVGLTGDSHLFKEELSLRELVFELKELDVTFYGSEQVHELVDKIPDLEMQSELYVLFSRDQSSVNFKKVFLEKAAQRLVQNNQSAKSEKLLIEAYQLDKELRIAVAHLNLLLSINRPKEAFQHSELYLVDHPEASDLIQLSIAIAEQNGRIKDVLSLRKKLQSLGFKDHKNEQELFKLYLSLSELRKAERIADEWMAKSESLTDSKMVQIARLYDWLSRSYDAVLIWYRLLDGHYKIEAEQRALAIGQGNIPSLLKLKIYEKVISRRPLSKVEFGYYEKLLLEEYSVGLAKTKVESYLLRHPENHQALWLLRKILEETINHDALVEVDKQIMSSKMILDESELLRIANYQWKNKHPIIALNLLLNHQESGLTLTSHYWSLVAEIAWYTDRTDVANAAYKKVLDESPNFTATQLVRALEIFYLYNDQRSIQRLGEYGWKKFKSYDFLVNAIDSSVNLSEWGSAGDLVSSVDIENIPGRLKSRYRTLLARIKQQNNRYDEALSILSEELTQNPDNDVAIELLYWLLADSPTKHSTLLKKHLYNIPASAVKKRDVWPAIAAGWLRLGEPNKAIQWYEKQYLDFKDDWVWLAGFADILGLAGRHADAFNLKQRSYSLMKDVFGEDRELRVIRARLFESLGGEMAGYQALGSNDPGDGHLSKSWLLVLLEWAIRDGDRFKAIQLIDTSKQSSYRIPGWIRLSYAMKHIGEGTIREVLREEDSLPLADEVIALSMIGKHGIAYAMGLEGLDKSHSDESLIQVRNATVSVASELPSGFGFKSTHSSNSLFENHRSDASLFTLHDHNISLGSILSWNDISFENVANPLEEERYFKTQLGISGAKSDFTLGAFYYDRNYNNLAGLEADFSFKGSARTRHEISLLKNGYSDISPSLGLVGKKDSLGYHFTYRIDRSLSSAFESEFAQYNAISNELIGSGLSSRANLTYQLMHSDPRWSVSLEAAYVDNTLEEAYEDTQEALGELGLGGDAIISDRYCYIGTGTELSNGRIDSLTRSKPSPHFRLAMSVGYQCSRKVVDYAFEAAIGWRLFGGDELNFGLKVGKSEVSNEEISTVFLSYNNYIGR